MNRPPLSSSDYLCILVSQWPWVPVYREFGLVLTSWEVVLFSSFKRLDSQLVGLIIANNCFGLASVPPVHLKGQNSLYQILTMI